MVGSIDPGCETIRGTHWPVKVAGVFGTRVAETILASGLNRPHQQAGHMDASDPIRPQKTLAARGPSTYGSRRSPGRRSRVASLSAVRSERLLPRGLACSRPFGCVSLAGCGRLPCGARSRRGRPPCRCLAAPRSADPATAFRGHVGVGNAAARAALVAALVDGCRCAPLGFLPSDATMLVSFLDGSAWRFCLSV